MSLNSAESQDPVDQTSQDTEENPKAATVNKNLIDDFDEDQLVELAEQCRNGYLNDKKSRAEWEDDLDTWIKLAKQIREERRIPGLVLVM